MTSLSKIAFASLVVAALVAPNQAQDTPAAFPDANTGGRSGSTTPLGYYSFASNTNLSRSQIHVPAAFLPSHPTVITALELLPFDNTRIDYGEIRIDVDRLTPGSGLSSRFADNVPNAVRALTIRNRAILHRSGRWLAFTFDTPIAYDGRSDLVLDVHKYVRGVTLGSGTGHKIPDPQRYDVPRMRIAVGPNSWTQSTATTSVFCPALRLRFRDAATINLSSPRGGTNNNRFSIGGRVDATLHATAGSTPYGMLLAGGAARQPVRIPGIRGELRIDLNTYLILGAGTTSSNGTVTRGFPIPSEPRLLGLRPMVQGYVLQNGSVSLTSSPQFRVEG